MVVTMHPIMQMLEETRDQLGLSKRQFAISKLDMTEDNYSNWLRRFPGRINNKQREAIKNLLSLSETEFKQLF